MGFGEGFNGFKGELTRVKVVNTFYGARYRAITSGYGFLAVHAGHIPGRLVGFRGVRDLE